MEVFYKKAILKTFAIFTEKHLWWIHFFHKDACNFLTKWFQYWCFPENIGKFLRTHILQTFTNDCFYLLPIRTMNCFIPRYVLAFQHLFHLILLCVMFLSFSFFFSYFLCSLRLAEDKATYPRKKKKIAIFVNFKFSKKLRYSVIF